MSFDMKRILSLTALFSIWGALFFASAGGATLQGLQPGMEGPEFSLKTVGGEARSFADLKGEKLTMLVFWSTWSSKSEKALARMEKLYEKYQGQGLAIVGVNADEPRISDKTVADMKAVQEKLKIGFPMLLDQGLAAFHEYGVIALPTTIVLDKERVLRYELSGFPLVGAETLVDFVVATIEGKKTPRIEEKARYQPNKIALRFYNMGKTPLKSKRMAESAGIWFNRLCVAPPEPWQAVPPAGGHRPGAGGVQGGADQGAGQCPRSLRIGDDPGERREGRGRHDPP